MGSVLITFLPSSQTTFASFTKQNVFCSRFPLTPSAKFETKFMLGELRVAARAECVLSPVEERHQVLQRVAHILRTFFYPHADAGMNFSNAYYTECCTQWCMHLRSHSTSAVWHLYCLNTWSASFHGRLLEISFTWSSPGDWEDRLSLKTLCVPFFGAIDFSPGQRTGVGAEQHKGWTLLDAFCFPHKIDFPHFSTLLCALGGEHLWITLMDVFVLISIECRPVRVEGQRNHDLIIWQQFPFFGH